MESKARSKSPPTSDTVSTEPRQRPPATAKTPPADVRRVEDALRKRLGTDVRMTSRRRGRGFITISYYSNDDLARLLELVLGEPFAG